MGQEGVLDARRDARPDLALLVPQDALVLDAATFPREKPCAGWITPEVVVTPGIFVDRIVEVADRHGAVARTRTVTGRVPYTIIPR